MYPPGNVTEKNTIAMTNIPLFQSLVVLSNAINSSIYASSANRKDSLLDLLIANNLGSGG